MANEITLDNINTLAQVVTSVNDGDYIYIFKYGADGFSRIEVNLFKQIFGNGQGGSSGIDSTTYEAIKSNVNTIQQKVDDLISALAGIAFNALPRPQTIGELTWPTIDSNTPMLISPSENSIDVGTSNADVRTKTFTLKGVNLTKSIGLSVSDASFAVSPTIVSANDANNGVTITITHTDTSINGGSASGTLTITSDDGVFKSISLTARKGSNIETQVQVNVTLVGCSINGIKTGRIGTVQTGGTFTATLVPDTGYTLPSEITVNGTHGTVSYNNGAISIPNVTTDITIIATATQSEVQDYVTGMILHLDGMNQGNVSGHWIDTVGNKDFTINNAVNEENGISLNGFKFDSSSSYGLCDISSDTELQSALIASGCTIEVCFTPLLGMKESNNARPLFVTNTQDNICAIVLNGHFDFRSRNSNTSNCGFNLPNNNYEGTPQCISINEDLIVQNGIKGETYVSVAPIPTKRDYSCMEIGHRINQDSTTKFANAIIHSIRIYDSKLSEEEMRSNQEVDNNKYNLNITIANGNS